MSRTGKFIVWTGLYLTTMIGCAYMLGLGYGAGCTAILNKDTTPERKEEDPEEE